MALVYEKGQVVIPKYLRDIFGIKPGSNVHFNVENNRIYIDPADEVMAELNRLRAIGATQDFETIQKEIREVEEKRKRRMLDVPRL